MDTNSIDFDQHARFLPSTAAPSEEIAGLVVIQTENDSKKEVFQGDIGTIEKIDPVEQEVTVRFDERLVTYDYGELDEVSLAYAVTIRKAQGSEFPAVVIPDAMQHYMLLQRILIYTGITRAKRLLVVAGQKKALGLAVRLEQSHKRYSGLQSGLKQGPRSSVVPTRAQARHKMKSEPEEAWNEVFSDERITPAEGLSIA